MARRCAYWFHLNSGGFYTWHICTTSSHSTLLTRGLKRTDLLESEKKVCQKQVDTLKSSPSNRWPNCVISASGWHTSAAEACRPISIRYPRCSRRCDS